MSIATVRLLAATPRRLQPLGTRKSSLMSTRQASTTLRFQSTAPVINRHETYMHDRYIQQQQASSTSPPSKWRSLNVASGSIRPLIQRGSQHSSTPGPPATTLSSASSLITPRSRSITKTTHIRHFTTTHRLPAPSHPQSPPPPPTSTSTPTSALKAPLKTLSQLTPHENIYTLPNILTFSRLLSAPLIGYLILTPTYPHIYALALFTYASLTDLLDGFLARYLNAHTVVGSVIDPMADKLLMTICTFSLAYTSILPLYAAVVIIGRDVALAISAIWWRWISLPPPKTMGRYWDFSLPSAEVRPTEISKINTLLQMLLIGNAMVLPVVPGWLVEMGNLWGVFEGWCGLVAATTVWSGLSYVGNREAVRIVSQEEVKRVLEARGEAVEEKVGDKV